MLELGDETPISGTQRPSVFVVDDVICGNRQEGLNGQHQTFAKYRSLSVIDAWHGWGFVKFASNAMTIEIGDHAKTMAACSSLHRSSQVAESGTRLGGVHRVTLSKPRRVQQPRSHRRHTSDGNTRTGIREVTVQLSRHIEVDQVAVVKLPLE